MTVRQVSLELLRLALAGDYYRRQRLTPGPELNLFQSLLSGFLGARVDVHRREHVHDDVRIHADVVAFPIPELGRDSHRVREALQRTFNCH